MHFVASALQIFPYKNFFYFFLKKPALKKLLTFSQKKKKALRIFGETELSFIFFKRAFLIFLEMELFSPKNKTFQDGTFRAQKIKKIHYEKICYILGNEIF